MLGRQHVETYVNAITSLYCLFSFSFPTSITIISQNDGTRKLGQGTSQGDILVGFDRLVDLIKSSQIQLPGPTLPTLEGLSSKYQATVLVEEYFLSLGTLFAMIPEHPTSAVLVAGFM